MENISLPVKAVWKEGLRSDKPVLLDPMHHRLHLVKREGGIKDLHLYKCNKAKEGCPVRVSYSKVSSTIVFGAKMVKLILQATNEILSVRGCHDHDNAMAKQWVAEKTREVVKGKASSLDVTPRAVLQELETAVCQSPVTAKTLPYAPKLKTVSMQLNRQKKQLRQELGEAIGNSWEEYRIPDKFILTGDGQPFCAIQVLSFIVLNTKPITIF